MRGPVSVLALGLVAIGGCGIPPCHLVEEVSKWTDGSATARLEIGPDRLAFTELSFDFNSGACFGEDGVCLERDTSIVDGVRDDDNAFFSLTAATDADLDLGSSGCSIARLALWVGDSGDLQGTVDIVAGLGADLDDVRVSGEVNASTTTEGAGTAALALVSSAKSPCAEEGPLGDALLTFAWSFRPDSVETTQETVCK